MSEIPMSGPEVPLDQIEALSALEKALGDALSQFPREEVLSRVIAIFPTSTVEIDANQRSRFHDRVQKVSVSMPEDLATAIREHTGPGGFSRFVAEAAERQLKNEQLRELLDELEAESGGISDEMREQVDREWQSLFEEE